MSLYNMLFGTNKATYFILPILGKSCDEYPRFRDCFISEVDENAKIQVLTRTGGGNRESYDEANIELTQMATYVSDEDDDEDSTYAIWTFDVPEQWKPDFKLIIEGRLQETSKEYKKLITEAYPEIAEFFKSRPARVEAHLKEKKDSLSKPSIDKYLEEDF